MCLIIDTNVFGKFLKNKSQDMQCIHDWLKTTRGKLVITKEGEYDKECKSYSDRNIMKIYAQSGKVKLCHKKEYCDAKEKLNRVKLISDDPHVLILAIAVNAKTLYSNDIDLGHDFKTLNLIKGAVYQNRTQQRPQVIAKILRNSPPC